MRRRPVHSFPRLLLATLVCVVGGALLHPTTAAAEGPTAVPSAVAARALGTASRDLPGLSGPVTQAQAAAWHPKGTTATTLTTPGGSTVVLTPAEVRPGSADFRAKVRWWGSYRVYFNKLETLRIAAGSAACAAIVKHVPVVGPYLVTACALLGVYATYARARDKCVFVRGWGLHYPQVLLYRGGYCR